MRKIIAERQTQLPVSTIGKLLELFSSKGIISLGPGEPDFGTPKNIVRAAKKSLDEGFTHYSPPGGRTELKEAIVRKLKKENKIRTNPENIIVTAGSTEAILLSLMCTIDPGEGVVLTDPGFLSYKPSVEVLNGMPISVPLREEDGFQFNIDRAKDVIVPEKTNVMIINSPLNPTGCVFTKKTLEDIADFAVENDILILSDEAYEKFAFGGESHISIGSLNGMEDRVVTLHSFSKTYAMPGFRIGYAAGSEELIKAMTKLHVFSSLSASTTSQIAAIEALTGPQKPVERMMKEYDRRRKFIYKRTLEIPGWSCLEPKGAFYVFANIRKFRMKSLNFSQWLLKEAKVAVVPGTEFGMHGEGYIRLSYATCTEKIEKGMERIERVCRKKLKK